MITFPNAKINIGLNVLRKRKDGYHDIETIFYPLKGIMYDALEIIKAEVKEKAGIKIHGMQVPGCKRNNLCIKAYELLKKEFSLPPINIHLLKSIPMGAGLGGGSADGAFMLKLLNDEFNLRLSPKQLRSYALNLGSDCPFFIDNRPAYATGKGEKLKPIETENLNGKFIVVVCPRVHVSTAEAYNTIDKQSETGSRKPEALEKLIRLPIEKWKGAIKNNFENPIFAKHPELKKIKQKLYSLGAIYASMSGSGSALYGIFSNEPPLKKIFAGHKVWKGKI